MLAYWWHYSTSVLLYRANNNASNTLVSEIKHSTFYLFGPLTLSFLAILPAYIFRRYLR
ncbi:hypothetical protein Hanom_Chr03g00246381 [Helianthus anomalus]